MSFNIYRATAGSPQESAAGNNAETTVRIMYSGGLAQLTASWMDEYRRIHPGISFSVAEAGEDQVLAPGHISILSADQAATLSGETSWKMSVGRDAVIVIFNTGNPYMEQIMQQGFIPENLAQLLTGKNWGILNNVDTEGTFQVSLAGSQALREQISHYLKISETELQGITVSTAGQMVQTVQSSPFNVGICRLVDIIDTDTRGFTAQIGIVPIDRNRNGRLDYFENIYGSPEAFTRGIWTRKYPSVLTGNIYAAAPALPTDEQTIAFLAWVNQQGQDMLGTYGFADISSSEKEANLNLLIPGIQIPDAPEQQATSFPWVRVLLILAAAALLAYGIAAVRRNSKLIASAENFRMGSVFSPNSIKAPAGLYYDRSHTWTFMEKDGSVRIGIDDFLQHITGPLTRVKMKEPGEKVRKGEKIITLIRDGKQLEIYAPVSGTIRQHNEDLLLNSKKINTSPYTEGWIYTIEPTNWVREIQFMFMGDEYREWISEEFARLRDFFAMTSKSNSLVYQHVVLQDGGEISDNILANLDPEVWEDFQTKFIDTSR